MAKSFLQQKMEAQNMMLTPKSVVSKPVPVPVRNNVVHNQARTGASLPAPKAVAEGPSLPLGKPSLVNVFGKGTKEWLYGMKDDDLTPDQIIRKYQFVADDMSMDYDRKKEMIKEGQKSLGRLRNKEAFNNLFGRATTNYGQVAADLDAELGAQLKSSAFGGGFFDEFGLGLAHKGTHFIADKLNKPELTQAIDQDRQFIETAKKTNPSMANAGSIAGGFTRDAGLYLLGAPLVEAGLAGIGAKLPRVGALVNKNTLTKFGANVLGQQAIDTAIMQPVVALQGAAEGKTREQILEEMKQQALMDLLFNAGMGVAGAGIKAAGKYAAKKGIQNPVNVLSDKVFQKIYGTDGDRLVKQVQKSMQGKMKDGDLIYVGETPSILKKYGVSDHALSMKQSTIPKTAYPAEYRRALAKGTGLSETSIQNLQGHNLGFEVFRLLPEKLKEPVAILKSSTQKDSVVVLTDVIDTAGRPVIVPIHIDKNGQMGITNEIASIYGKKDFVKFLETEKEKGNLLFLDKKRNLQAIPADGLQLSEVDTQADPIFHMITDAQQNVKDTMFPSKGQNENTVLHEKMNVPGAAGASKNISSMNLSSDMKNGSYGRIVSQNDNPLLMPEARQRLEEELRVLQDADILDQKYNDIFLREGAEAAEAFLKRNEQRKEEVMDMLYMPLKKEELQGQRIYNALHKELSPLLAYSGKENKRAAQEAIARAMMEVRTNGVVSEKTKRTLFETLFDMGKATNRQSINREVKDALKKSKFSISSQDAANIADFDTFRKNLMGKVGSVTKDGKNTRVDVAYQELSERFPEFFPDSIVHPAEQLRQIAKVAEGMKIQEFPLKDVTSAEEKEWILQEFMEKFSSAEKQYQNLVKFEAERKARQRQRILESGEEIDVSQLSAKEVAEMYKRKDRLQKKAEKVKADKILTEGDQAILQKFLHGEISEETIRNTPGVNADAVLEIALAEKPYRTISKQIERYAKSRAAKRYQMAEDSIEQIHFGKDGWKDPIIPRSLMSRSGERATEKVAPKERAKIIIERYFTPVHEAEADRQLWLREKKEMANSFGLKKKKKFTIYDPIGKQNQKVDESGMVQFLGERRADLADLVQKTDEASIRKKEALEAEIKAAEAQLTADEKQRIEAVIPILQKEYSDMLAQTNEVLIRNGYPPIQKRRNYWPHMFSEEADDPLQVAFQKLGFSQGFSELPADIAGKTDSFRPGKSFSSHMLSRTGNKTDFDALRGYEHYIESMSNVIFHTDNIRNLRALEDAVRYHTAPDSIQKEISKIQKNKNLTMDEKRVQLDAKYAELDEIGKQKNGHTLQNYAMYLNEYTNLLAGKQSVKDINWEKTELGRGITMFLEKLNRNVAGNMIAGNISSAITNSIPFTQGMPLISISSRKRGLQEGFAAAFSRKMDPLTKKSAFLTTRWPEIRMNRTTLDKYSDFIGGVSNWVDKMTTQSIWRGRYYDNVKKGMVEKEAIREADDFARRLFGGRSKGAVPPLFQAKNPITRTLTMFQLEPANQIDFLLKDLPKELKERGARGVLPLAEMIGASYVFNDIFEKWVGNRPAIDPLGVAVNFYEDWTGEDVKNIIDAFADGKDGEGFRIMEETEEPEPEKQEAVQNLVANVGQYVPYFGGIVFDGGRIPQSSALPDPKPILSAAFSKDDEEEGEDHRLRNTFLEEGTKLLNMGPVIGLNQIKKTMGGLKTMQEGGSYKQSSDGEKLQFAVDAKSPLACAQAALFGKWATPGGQEYVENGFKPLSAKRTEAQRDMQQKFGTTPKDFFDTFQGINQAETREGKLAALQSSGLSDAEKEYIYKMEIFTGKTQLEDFDKMRSFGLSFDQAAKAQTALEGIEKKYDEMLDDGLKDKNTMAANERYDYINRMQIPAGQKQLML